MNHTKFENEMFACVNRQSEMQEISRKEIERAAAEEYQDLLKCKKVNAVVWTIVWLAAFGGVTYAMAALNWLGRIPAEISVVVTAVFSLVAGMNIKAMATKIKNGGR